VSILPSNTTATAGDAAAAPANGHAPPDWGRFDEDVFCPLCEYILRGLIEPRCPECGYRFTWPEVLDPCRRNHPYLFEHHPDRNAWSFWKTAGMCALSVLTVVVILSVHDVVASRAARTNLIRQVEAGFVPLRYRGAEAFIDRYGAEAYVDQMMPAMPFWQALQRGFYRTLADAVPFLLLLLSLLWAAATFLTLLIFRWSMRQAKIRPIHVLRCVVYTYDVIFWLGLAWMAMIPVRAYFTPTRAPFSLSAIEMSRFVLLMVTVLPGLAAATVAVYRLEAAYRLYLRFDHPWATVLASQIIMAMLILNIFAMRVWF
jgi:hypothetical protein